MKTKLMAFVERIQKPVGKFYHFSLYLFVALSLACQLWGNEITAHKLTQSTIFFLTIAIFIEVKHLKERLEKRATEREEK